MASTITPTQFLAIADNIAKTLLDLENVQINTDASADGTINTGVEGVTNSLYARFSALSANDQAGMIGRTWEVAAQNIVGFTTVVKTALYPLYKQYLEALDFDIGSVRTFLVVNGLQVHAEFAGAFNWMAQNGRTLGLNAGPINLIPPALVFVPAEQVLASISVTGAAAGTFSTGTPLAIATYGPQQLYIKNTAGIGSAGTATSFTITYTDQFGNQNQTTTQALSGSLGAGALLAVGSVSGSAVTNIAVNSGGANGDTFAVTVEPLRAVTY